MGRRKMTPIERVMSRRVVTEGGCWEFTGTRDKNGYGFVSVEGVQRRVHRFVYETIQGPIPAGMQLDHLCRNPPCFNPGHLEVVTPRENTLRGVSIQARNATKTHCLRGHPFAGENLLVSTGGERVCLACKRIRKRQAKERKMATAMTEVTP